MITLEPIMVQTIVSAIIPVFLGFIMKTSWSSKLKSNIGIVAAAVVTLVTNAVNETGVAFLSWEMLQVFFVGLAIQLATYNGFYRPALDPNEKLPTLLPSRFTK